MKEVILSRPNIVYLHSHDTGRYIQPYGYAVPTPNLQSFAEQGVLFRQAFCVAPTCSPSRAALLTGVSAHESGMLGLAHRGFRLRDPSWHMAHWLAAVGYETILGGVSHVAPHRELETLGYTTLLRPADHHASTLGPLGVQTIDRLADRPDRPFFLDLGFHETHREFPTEQSDDARYTRAPAILPDTPQTRADFAAYRASARMLDQAYGMILDRLEARGLAHQTLVMITTDHGIAFPDMKCSLSDHGTGVLLMMRGPGFSGGRVIDPMVTHLDIFPTLARAIDAPAPARLSGKPLQPLVDGSVSSLHEEVFSEVTFHASYEPKRSIRTERYRYVRRIGGYDHPVLPNTDAGPSKDAWLDAGWRETMVAREALFDLVFDPAERFNRIADPTLNDVRESLLGRLDAWMRQTNDPLLAGEVRPPSGSTLNPVEDTHPRTETAVRQP
jgi:arylsulfatase A-like enzyme